MHLLVGLGNPGAVHQGNRHNVGFVVADRLIERYRLSGPKRRFQSESYSGIIAGRRVLLIKPETYMNASGQAVGEAMRYFKLAPADVTVFYDELDLAPLKVRARLGGGAAGHNGIRSTAAHIGADFQRVRIGIGHPGDKTRVHGHVLGDFSKAEAPAFEALAADIAEQAGWLIKGDLARFQSELARRRGADTAPAQNGESAARSSEEKD